MSDHVPRDLKIVSDVELILNSPDLTNSQLIQNYNYIVSDHQDNLITSDDFNKLRQKFLIEFEKRLANMFDLFKHGELTEEFVTEFITFLIAIGILKFGIKLIIPSNYNYETIAQAKSHFIEIYQNYLADPNFFLLRESIQVLAEIKRTIKEF